MKLFFRTIGLLLLISFSTVTFRADTMIADYRQRVTSATEGITELIEAYADQSAQKDSAAKIPDIYRELFLLLPPQEDIVLNGEKITVDNHWFSEGLEASKSAESMESKMQILDGIFARLQRLQDEIAASESAGQPAKDEDKLKIAEILQRPEYRRPQNSKPNVGEELLRRLAEWLESLFPRPISASPQGGFASLSGWLRLSLIALLSFIGVYILYRIIRAVLKDKAITDVSDSRVHVILGETIDEGSEAETLFNEAENMANAGDIRGAIRKTYVGLLLGFSKRKVITLAKHKTNSDYLLELKKTPAFYGPAGYLTATFEKFWYGGRKADTTDWEDFRRRCRQILGL